ncbi:MAG TPA: NAD(P)-binding domain-containing protein [Anaerolineales bacterium]|nr:NAD(P)-binding domain-containing protein [Anaerolineales bacterium]HLE04412.1 NAD(P)-binding domain-containing protein [Anaerolineales bacterium]
MRIAVIGKGKIGGTLGSKWLAAGHDVVFGVRTPAPSAPSQAPVADAIKQAEVVLFAVPASAMASILDAHSADLGGKILIDATNNMPGPTMSSVRRLTAQAPSSKVFRAFNSLGWENFANPTFGKDRADLFYCGPGDADASRIVEELVEAVGLRPMRVGGLDKVELVDSVTRLWFALATGMNMGRHTAFKVLSG